VYSAIGVVLLIALVPFMLLFWLLTRFSLV
jgi:hypothetical protein